MHRQMTHQVPGAELAAFIEREKETGVQPENSHKNQAADAAVSYDGVDALRAGAGSVWMPSPSM